MPPAAESASLVVAAASLASVLHAALPNHWLPFVLVGRALGWSRGKTLAVVALAGGAHVVATSALGLVVWGVGAALLEHLEEWGGRVAGTILLALGAVYLLRHVLGRHGHTHAAGDAIWASEHAHAEGGHAHDESDAEHAAHAGRERAAAVRARGEIATLLLALMLSPCEAIVPVFLLGVTFGIGYVVAIAVAFSLTTVAVMLLLTWLTLHGVERIEAPWLDRHEMLISGGILAAIGAGVLLVRP